MATSADKDPLLGRSAPLGQDAQVRRIMHILGPGQIIYGPEVKALGARRMLATQALRQAYQHIESDGPAAA